MVNLSCGQWLYGQIVILLRGQQHQNQLFQAPKTI